MVVAEPGGASIVPTVPRYTSEAPADSVSDPEPSDLGPHKRIGDALDPQLTHSDLPDGSSDEDHDGKL